ncbi:MAG: universal stress protein [Thermodesulfobacteriota bacterium]
MFTNIVFCSDFSPHADRALGEAAELARAGGGRLTVLHVVAPGLPLIPGEPPPRRGQPGDEEMARKLDAYLRQLYAPRLEGLRWRVALRRGHPSEEILAHLKEAKADLVVLGSQGLSGMGLVVLGSVAERVSRRAPCTCLVVR